MRPRFSRTLAGIVRIRRHFSFAPTGENAPPGSLSSASFTVEDGAATSVTLDFFDAQGLGTWTRNAGGGSE